MALDDDDPLWEQHSGGEGHDGLEWGEGDGEPAQTFYAALPEHTKFVINLLMDHPGERLTSDWIAARVSELRGDEGQAVGRQAVAAYLRPAAKPHRNSGRRLPFYLVARQWRSQFVCHEADGGQTVPAGT